MTQWAGAATRNLPGMPAERLKPATLPLRSQSDHMGALQATVEQLNQALVNKQAQVENLSNEITAKQQEIDGQKVSLETLNMELGEAKNKLSSSIPKPAPAVPADKPVSPSPRAGLLVRLLVAYFKKRNK
jgi:uncharacterized coiled-coil protein SlyX